MLTPDGLILDGRNRYAACLQVGVEPETVVYGGDDLAEYVIDCNSSRRHMTTGARAMANALVLAADGQRENGRWKYRQLNSKDLGNSMAEYVIDCNVRRNVTDSQRAMCEAMVYVEDGRRENGRWVRGSIGINSEVNTAWRSRLTEAGLVLDFAADLAQSVADGLVGLETRTQVRSLQANKKASTVLERSLTTHPIYRSGLHLVISN